MKKILPLVWIGAIAALAVLSGQLQGQSTHFFGIADDSEQTIRFGYPVEIVEVLVSEAAAVEAGAELIKVRRPDLSIQLTLIDDQIRSATAVHAGGAGTLGTRLKEKTAERAAALAELDVQIQALRSRRALNQKLLKDISGGQIAARGDSPLTAELDGLLEQRRQVDSSLNEQIAGLRAQVGRNADPFEAELAGLQDRKSELERQRDDLSVRATVAGRVGSINVRVGEQIAPFKSILTVHGESPRFVKGYIHENALNEVAVGQSVWIQPSRPTQGAVAIRAEVESLGTRIVEYPERLNKNPQVPAWGREAVIRLPAGSALMMGEKVMVSMRSPERPGWIVKLAAVLKGGGIDGANAATPDSATKTQATAQPIRSLIAGLDAMRIEPSGLVNEPGSDRFLVISDEEIEDDQAHLLSMNSAGELIGSKPVLGETSIDDLESISRDGEALYIAASLSFNRRGKQKPERCQLLRLRDTPAGFEPTAALDLCRAMQTLAQSSDDADTRQYLSAAIEQKTLDVESLAVRDNQLYLGFKSPLDSQGRTVIVVLGQLRALLEGATPQGRIWQRLILKDPVSGEPALLSDMVLHDQDLLLLAISGLDQNSVSHLWSLDLKSRSLRPLARVAGLRAEGISDRLIDGHLMLVSDGGGKRAPQYLPIAAGI